MYTYNADWTFSRTDIFEITKYLSLLVRSSDVRVAVAWLKTYSQASARVVQHSTHSFTFFFVLLPGSSSKRC